MFVASRRLFPIQHPDEKLQFDLRDVRWQEVTTASCLLGTPFPEVGLGTFRKYRLRCTYFGDSPTAALQFSFLQGEHGFPTTDLKPNTVSTPVKAIATTSTTTETTEFFTVKSGSRTDLHQWLQKDGTLSVRYSGRLHPIYKACVFQIILECWDFTSSSTSGPSMLPETSPTAWTRDISPFLSSTLPLTFDRDNQTRDLAKEFNVSNGADPSRFPIMGANVTRSFRLKGICAMTFPLDSIGITMEDQTNSVIARWTLSGFAGDGIKHRSILSLEAWTPEPLSVYPQVSFRATFRASTSRSKGRLYALTLEVEEHARDGKDNLSRVTKIFERPVTTTTTQIIRFPSRQLIGTFVSLFNNGLPILAADTTRHFILRLSCYDMARSNGTIEITLEPVGSPDKSIVIQFSLQSYSVSSDPRECFNLSTPIAFGDGRFASIPTTDWNVYAKYIGDTLSAIPCYITAIVLEAWDQPITSIHAPPSHTQSLLLLSQSVVLPDVPELRFIDRPFSVSLWMMNLGEFYDVEDEQAASTKHTVFVGNSYSIGLLGDGSLYATMEVQGSAQDFKWADQHLDNQNEWRHIALIWDTQVLQLAVDGVFQPDPQAFTGPLRSNTRRSQMGHPSFDGAIRNITFWSIALTRSKLQQWIYRVIGNEPGLLANLEFSSPKFLVNSSLSSFRPWILPNDAKFTLQSHALAVAPNGCACIGNNSALHMTGASAYTLEAWIAPCASSSDLLQVVAGKLDTISRGYALGVRGTKVVAWRNTYELASTTDLVVRPGEPVWRHICCVFDPLNTLANLFIYIDGKFDSAKRISERIDLDSAATPFTVGGACDYSATQPICTNSFCGYIDDVRLWSVPRKERDILNYMYAEPANNSAELALAVTFDTTKASSLGMPVGISYHDNCEVVLVNRKLTVTDMRTLQPLTKGEVSGTCANPEYEGGIEEEFAAPTVISTADTLTKQSFDDPVEDVWIKFIVGILKLIIMNMGLDVDDEDTLKGFARDIWTIDPIRSIITSFADVTDEPSEETRTGNQEVLQLTPTSLAGLRGSSQGSLGDLPEVVMRVGSLLAAIIRHGLSRVLLRCSRISWWSIMRLLVRFNGPVGIALFLADLAVNVAMITHLKDELNHDVNVNIDLNSRPGIRLEFDGTQIPQGFPEGYKIPIRTGGSSQTITVSLVPPPRGRTQHVSIKSLYPEVTVSPRTLLFPDGGSSQRVAISASSIPLDPNIVEFKLDGDSSASMFGSTLAFDIREQKILLKDSALAISLESPTATMSITLNAIVDEGENVTVNIADMSPDIQPEPGKTFTIDPPTVTFSRLSARRHQSVERTVDLSYKPPPLVSPTSRKRKMVEATAVSPATASKAQCLVKTEDKTHRTQITMIRAGKGDSYIIGDKTGDEPWKRILIDGGAGGTWPRIQSAMAGLSMGPNPRFEAVVVTHYDDDHINGILQMLNTGPVPAIGRCIFNGPDASRWASETAEGTAKALQYSGLAGQVGEDAEEKPPFYSPNQGRRLLARLAVLHIATVAPSGNPPAISSPGADNLGVFPRLVARICGPTTENVNTMHTHNTDPEAINRSSTILTMASKITDEAGSVNPDGLSFLFTGDAHDQLPDECDIRGGTTLLTPRGKDHFTVMKVPHHGSRRSEDAAFYMHYTADLYLISSHYRSHSLPSFGTIKAICDSRSAPVIVTTSRWQSSGIQQDLVPLVRQMLVDVGGELWVFDDHTDLEFALTNSITFEWEDGVLSDSWKAFLHRVPPALDDATAI